MTAPNDTLAKLAAKWETRSRNALPVDAMTINKCIRELREAMASIPAERQIATDEDQPDFWPIAKIVVRDQRIEMAMFYPPGLPDGEHDLYPAPTHLDEHTAAWFAVTQVLDEAWPGWSSGEFVGSGIDCAKAAILMLAARSQFFAEPAALTVQALPATPPWREWKVGSEYLPYHPSASHVPAEYRDGWNACFEAAKQAVNPAAHESFAAWFAAEHPDTEDRQGKFRMSPVRDLMRAAFQAARHSAPQAAGQQSIKVKRALFSFHGEQDWINKAQSRYANCGAPKGRYITVDANGHVMHMGKCFAAATKANAYPVTCYELQTNWGDDSATTQPPQPQEDAA